MSLVRRVAAAASFVAGMALSSIVACTHASSSAGTSSTGQALGGTYVPAAGSSASAEYRAITFFDSTGYFAYRNGCSGDACRSEGTYTYDGTRHLALTDGATHAVEAIDFQVTKVSASGSGGGSLLMASAPGLRLQGGAPVLVTGTDAALVAPIVEALMNGVRMQLFGESEDGGVGAGYCEPPNGRHDCALQDRLAQKNGDGTCSCVTRPTGQAYSVPITLRPGKDQQLYPTVQVSVAGGKTLTAILDTGSTGLWMSSALIPDAEATPLTGKNLSYSWGGDLEVTGVLETVPSVTLDPDDPSGGIVSTGPVVVGDITSIAKCPVGDCDIDSFSFNGAFDAVFGVGLRTRAELVSPMPSFGTSGTFVVSLDGYGLRTGHLDIDPFVGRIDAFTDTRAQLLPDGNGGWLDNQVPFCVNTLCGGGTAGGGALLDMGNPSNMVLVPQTPADYATLSVPQAPGSLSVPAGTVVTVRVGTTDPSGADTSPTWLFPVGSPAVGGLDAITANGSATGGNNLGIAPFYRFDLLYDTGLGQIGLAPKPVTRICDVKRALAATVDPGTTLIAGEEAMTEDNYPTIIDGLVAQLGCTVLRVYIDPNISDPTQYPQLYKDVVAYARGKGLRIYANPLATGAFMYETSDGVYDDDGYAQWIIAYASEWKPEYLGPFNESGIKTPADLEAIATEVRAGLASGASILVGPDAQHVEETQSLLGKDPDLPAYFDIWGSHNASSDLGSTATAWTALVTATAHPTWSSENPRAFSLMKSGQEIGVTAAIQGGVSGVVIYEAFPYALDDQGNLTDLGTGLADGIP